MAVDDWLSGYITALEDVIKDIEREEITPAACNLLRSIDERIADARERLSVWEGRE